MDEHGQRIDRLGVDEDRHLHEVDHDRLRGQVMRCFTPERVRGMRTKTQRITDDLIGKMRGKTRIDLVDDFSSPDRAAC